MVVMLLHTLDERLPKHDIGTQENYENRDKKIVGPQSHMGKILTNVEITKIESQNYDYSSLQDLHHRGFNSTPRNYLIPRLI